MESKINKLLSKSTFYPEKNEKLPEIGIMSLPEKYEKMYQMSNGSYTKMFCVKDRGKDGPIFAAKHMKDKTVDGNTEVEILRSLQSSEHVVKIVETVHQSYQTILITEYLAGQSHLTPLSSRKDHSMIARWESV